MRHNAAKIFFGLSCLLIVSAPFIWIFIIKPSAYSIFCLFITTLFGTGAATAAWVLGTGDIKKSAGRIGKIGLAILLFLFLFFINPQSSGCSPDNEIADILANRAGLNAVKSQEKYFESNGNYPDSLEKLLAYDEELEIFKEVTFTFYKADSTGYVFSTQNERTKKANVFSSDEPWWYVHWPR